MGKGEVKPGLVIELYDPTDEKGLAYFSDWGVWVRDPSQAYLYLEDYRARADHSVLSQHMLHVRIMEYDPAGAL